MKNARTYYDIWGVSRDATLEEITTAKNALAKIYHPDANVHKDIDTTELMQEILEAYRTLSDPEKRSAYNIEMFGQMNSVYSVLLRSDRTKTAMMSPHHLSHTGIQRTGFTTSFGRAGTLWSTNRKKRNCTSGSSA